VPFLMRAGKGLDERMAEVRVTFKKQTYNDLVPGEPNELIIRIQPDEGIYWKCTNKHPGWNQDGVSAVQLDMNYKRSFPGSYVASAYERVFLNAARGDQSLFVGSSELTEAWRIFTPLLDEIDQTKPQPVMYPFGSRVIPGLAELASQHNLVVEECPMQIIENPQITDHSQGIEKSFRSRANPNRASARAPIQTNPFGGNRLTPHLEEPVKQDQFQGANRVALRASTFTASAAKSMPTPHCKASNPWQCYAKSASTQILVAFLCGVISCHFVTNSMMGQL